LLPGLFSEHTVIIPCLTHAELLRELGGYDTRQRYNYEDWELAIRMLASGWPIVTIPTHLTKYRVRRDSLYRSMTYVQNQVMRELLFNTHRDIVSRFAVEIAMQFEYEWKKLVYPDNENGNSKNLFSKVNSGMFVLHNMIKRYRSLLSKTMKMFL
jgi:hypothetical protein